MRKAGRKQVGNCPRCGMPIYEDADQVARKSCICAPLELIPAPYPYPVMVPPQPPTWIPYQPPNWPTIIVSGAGTKSIGETRTDAPVPYVLT